MTSTTLSEIDADKKFIKIQTSVISLGLIANVGAFLFLGVGLLNRIDATPTKVTHAVEEIAAESVERNKAIEQHLKEYVDSSSYRGMLLEAIESSSDCYIAIDDIGNISHWSVGASEMFGADRKAAVGYGLGFIIPHSIRQAHHEGFQLSMHGDKSVRRRIIKSVGLHSDGSLFPVNIELWISPGVGALAKIMRA